MGGCAVAAAGSKGVEGGRAAAEEVEVEVGLSVDLDEEMVDFFDFFFFSCLEEGDRGGGVSGRG